MTENHLTIKRGEYTLSTDPALLDLKCIHDFLSQHSYWARHIPYERVVRASKNSLNFAIYYHDQQVAYARVISDFTTIAYLGDVFVLPDYQKRGLSKWMIETIRTHPDLQQLRRWILLTSDAHKLYEKFGWKQIANPANWMDVHNPNPYT
jgi:GNAT superfamily N-acetyltransferase